MRHWIVFAGLASLFVASTGLADAQTTDDDDEYEEVVVRRKKKKKLPAENARADNSQPAVVTTGAGLPAAPVAVPATVLVPAVVAVPAVAPAAPAAPTVAEKPEEPPPPPEPPAEDAAEPRRLVRYFCRAWKDNDYLRMWWAMSPMYRKQVSLKKFKKLFTSDKETNGGLVDENIIETAKTKDGNEGVKVELIFKFPRAQHRFVMAAAERQTGGAFRLVESPIIPLDLDDL